MSNTYEYEGKVYRIVPDKERAYPTRSPCDQCAFAVGGTCADVAAALDCLTGAHHYVLAEVKEQA